LLIQPSFFASVIQYVLMANSDDIVFEKCDNFQKQTYRNRCYIYGANGKQLLTVPILHSKGLGRQKTRDIKIDNSFGWQKHLIKSLESSYRSSPYFEYYEDDIIEIFNKQHTSLLDFNLYAHEVISQCLQLENRISFSESFIENLKDGTDFRYLVEAKKEPEYNLKKYTQVFESKHGFIANLSVLDLLFNEGTNALQYLENHKTLLLK
jgi:hypothetical protein